MESLMLLALAGFSATTSGLQYPHRHNHFDFTLKPLATSSNRASPVDYSNHLMNFDAALNEIKKYIYLPVADARQAVFESGLSHPYAQYAILLYSVNYLADAATRGGQEWYEQHYLSDVVEAITYAFEHPVEAAQVVKAKMERASSRIAAIREVIKRRQEVCEDAVSFQCDFDIHVDILQSPDAAYLEHQAYYLQIVSSPMKLFLTSFETMFDKVAQAGKAESFLLNGKDVIWPLVSAIASANLAVSAM